MQMNILIAPFFSHFKLRGKAMLFFLIKGYNVCYSFNHGRHGAAGTVWGGALKYPSFLLLNCQRRDFLAVTLISSKSNLLPIHVP